MALKNFAAFIVLLLFYTPIWASDHSFSSVLLQASEENRVIVALFLGAPESDFLSEELLTHPDFLKKIDGEAVVCCLSPEKKEFHAQYTVPEHPTLLLLDPRGKEFARLGPLPLNPEEYGEKIHHLIENFEEVCCKVNSDFDEEKWKSLFEKALSLSITCYRDVILEKGVKREKGSFFHLQKYALLLKKYTPKQSVATKWKKKLLQRKSVLEEDLPFEVAALEFQKNAAEALPTMSFEKIAKPLLRYLQWKDNQKNGWKAEWMLAEYLVSKNDWASAREHLEAAHAQAPEAFKEVLGRSLEWIQERAPSRKIPV